MHRFLLNFLKLLILNRLYLPCILLITFVFTLSLSLSVGDLLVEFVVDSRTNKLTHVNLDKAIGRTVR